VCWHSPHVQSRSSRPFTSLLYWARLIPNNRIIPRQSDIQGFFFFVRI
jgi:hypothetical protein